MSPSLLGRREAFRPENEDVDFDFIALSYMETTFRHYSGSPVCDPSYSHFPQRWESGAAESGSEARTDAVRRRLHAFVKRVLWHGHPDLLISFG